MLQQITPQISQEMATHLGSLLRSFISDVEVNSLLMDIALEGRKPPLDELQRRFDALGFDRTTLPIDLDQAMETFIQALVKALHDEAKEPASPLYNRVSLALLEDIHRHLRPAEKADMEKAREEYCKHLTAKYRLLEFIGLPVFDFEEKAVPFDDLFVEPKLTPWTRELTLDTVSIGRVIEQTKRSVILGDPGFGKTALLQYLALVFAKGEGKRRLGLSTNFLPLLIPLRDYLSKRPLLSRQDVQFPLNYLYTCVAEAGVKLPGDFFEHYLERGNCLILFDGLDEIFNPPDRIDVRNLIFHFSQNIHPENRVIVTARLADYAIAPLYKDEFDHFVLSPFTWPQITEFVKAWYKLREPSDQEAQEKARHLLSALQSSRASRLAVNPLYLTIMALIHRRETELPNRRAKLYDYVTRAVLMRDRWKGLPDELDEEVKRPRLEHIAFWMQSQPGRIDHVEIEVNREELHRELARFLQAEEELGFTEAQAEATQFINWAVKRYGLLMDVEEERYKFKHRTFQEYFAACDVYRRYTNAVEPSLDVVRAVIQTHLHDPAWREVHLFLAGKLESKPATQITREILERETEYKLLYPRDILMALRFLAEDVRVSRELRGKVLDNLFATWLEFWKDKPKATWSSGLWRRFHKEVLSILPEMRGSLSERELLDRLLATLQDEKQVPVIRVGVVQVLLQLGNPEDRVVSALIRALDDREPSVQDMARRALTQLGQDHPKVAEELEKIAADEGQSLSRRTHVARALMHLHRAHDLTLRIALLRLSRPADVHLVKEWVRCVAEEKTGEGPIPTEKVEPLEPLLLQALRSNYSLAQAQAAWVVGKIGFSSTQVVAALMNASKAENPLVREQARLALGVLRAGGSEVETVLREGLGDADDRARKVAQVALRKLGN